MNYQTVEKIKNRIPELVSEYTEALNQKVSAIINNPSPISKSTLQERIQLATIENKESLNERIEDVITAIVVSSYIIK